jgi:two-component system sensor histidine kinase/response regulator
MNEANHTIDSLQKELSELRQSYHALKAHHKEDMSEGREKSYALLSHAVRSVSECISITDMEDNIIFVNDAFLKTYQYEEHELLGKNIQIVRSPQNRAELVDVILPSTLEGGWQGEVLNRRKDGTDFPVYVSASVIKDFDGVPVALIGVSLEISGKKKTELESQVRSEMTHSLVETDNLSELLRLIHQSLGKVLYAENCFVAIHDSKTGLFSFPYFVDQFDTTPEPLAMGKSCSAYVFRTGKPLLFSEELFQKLFVQGEVERVGSPSPSWIGVPLKTPSRTIGVLVLQHYEKKNVYSERDIQFLDSAGSKIAIAIERRQAEIELRESELLVRSITDSAQDAILMMDHEGVISYWNPAAVRIFGYTREEAIGQNLHNFIVPQRYHSAHQAAFPGFQKTGHGAAIGKTMDLEALTKTGQEISIQLSLSAFEMNNQWNAVGIIRDITDQKKVEQALMKAKQEAETANKFKSMFLANMSHEIRTPLNAIIGFSQLMNRDKLLSDKQKEYNKSIIHAGEHLLALINDILELSKIEAGRVVISPSNIDLHALIDDIQMIFKERTIAKNLRFICERDEDLPQYVLVDEGKLRQIFVNLIGNALKFTEEGGIAVRSRAEEIDQETYLLTVEVHDTGPGIPAEEIGKLFRHFEQTSSGISKGSGTGLGLALSRELAILMGGDITVSSEVGKGSLFTFQVRMQKGSAHSVDRNTARGVIGIENPESTYRILVVDDKEDNLKVASTLLNLVGFETREAINGEEAIAKFEKWSPHLILMDMRMPVMDGYEATRRIKATDKGKVTPIVALTASTFEDELKKIEALGIQGFIRKPFREIELFNTIGKILGIKYIYDMEKVASMVDYGINEEAIDMDMAKMPNSLLLKMQNALDIADLDLFIQLTKSNEKEHPVLAQKLMELAANYDYDQLQEILHRKEKKR